MEPSLSLSIKWYLSFNWNPMHSFRELCFLFVSGINNEAQHRSNENIALLANVLGTQRLMVALPSQCLRDSAVANQCLRKLASGVA